MKKLTIHEFGPLRDASIELDRLNLIIGMQGSGKSCVLRVACLCTWIEKCIFLNNSAEEFEDSQKFLDILEKYYQISGFMREDTVIGYESPYMSFTYDNSHHTFCHCWNESNRAAYCRPNVSYIPADRNIVASVPQWSRIPLVSGYMVDFMGDWNAARRGVSHHCELLNLGMAYKYDREADKDCIRLSSGATLPLKSGSSGLQSLIPLLVYLEYACGDIYTEEKEEKKNSYSERQQQQWLVAAIYNSKYGKEKSTGKTITIEGEPYIFPTEEEGRKFCRQINSLLYTDHAEMFIEEPEDNLFPPTQVQLTHRMVAMVKDNARRNTLFMATHSPYILNTLLEEEDTSHVRLCFTYPAGNGQFCVRMLTKEEIAEIYEYSVDLFFNFDAFTD